jgi:hypothetical protein
MSQQPRPQRPRVERPIREYYGDNPLIDPVIMERMLERIYKPQRPVILRWAKRFFEKVKKKS